MNICGVSGSVSVRLTALLANIAYYITALGVGSGADGTKKPAAFVGAVTGIYVNVQGIKTSWAMVS